MFYFFFIFFFCNQRQFIKLNEIVFSFLILPRKLNKKMTLHITLQFKGFSSFSLTVNAWTPGKANHNSRRLFVTSKHNFFFPSNIGTNNDLICCVTISSENMIRHKGVITWNLTFIVKYWFCRIFIITLDYPWILAGFTLFSTESSIGILKNKLEQSLLQDQ